MYQTKEQAPSDPIIVLTRGLEHAGHIVNIQLSIKYLYQFLHRVWLSPEEQKLPKGLYYFSDFLL